MGDDCILIPSSPGTVSQGWIVIFDRFSRIVAHASYQVEGLLAKGRQEAVLSSVEGQGSITLSWDECGEISGAKLADAEGVSSLRILPSKLT